MAIIVSKNGKNAEKIEPSSFPREADLQAYIAENPEALPLYEIEEDIKLLVVAREFSTNSGPIDVLGIDANGQIYIIETKLYKNPDKRLVLAQVLDYGAALWSHYGDFSGFLAQLEAAARKEFGCSFSDKASEFFGVDQEGVAELLDQTHQCLDNGRFRFVVLMDRLDDRLKDMIVFVNQNSQFDIYGVELEYYQHEEYKILIPRLFGAKVKKTGSIAPRRKWDEGSFFEDARTHLSDEQLDAVKSLFTFSTDRCDKVSWGTGKARGSFSAKVTKISNKSIYSVFSDGQIHLNFAWLHDTDTAFAFRQELKQEVERLEGFNMPEDWQDRWVRVPIDVWGPKIEEFVEVISKLLEKWTGP